MITSYEFDAGKFLCTMSEGGARGEAIDHKPTDHLVVLDVSYSMAGELVFLREHLKKRLITLVQPDDTLTVFWFSGKGEHGKLFSLFQLETLRDVKTLFDTIDRFIKPVGMTGFKEPLEDVLHHLIARKARVNAHANLIFMSDGCDNQWPREEILSVVDELSKIVDSAIFVEYGYYADRRLLTTMAERLGGSVICAEDFPSFQPVLEKGVTTPSTTGAFVMAEVPGCVDYAFGFLNGDLRFYEAREGMVRVPSDPKTKALVHDLFWVSSRSVGEAKPPSDDVMLGAVAAFACRMRGDLARPLLLQIREPELLDAFSRCFGKQRFTEFQQKVVSKIGTPVVRLAESEVGNYFRTDLPTILDLFEALSRHGAKAMIEDASFKYSRISKKMEVEDPNPLVFRPNGRDGYPIADMVLNSNRPNISMRLRKQGTLSLDVPGRPRKLPKEIAAFQWRNYALVADGIVHVDLLPIQMSPDAYREFSETWIFRALDKVMAFPGISDNGDFIGITLNLERVGLTSDMLTRNVLGARLADMEVDLLIARAKQKVWKDYLESYSPPNVIDPVLAAVFGDEEAKWLADKGFRNGIFEPKRKAAQTSDVYMAVELETKIKSFNTLPKISEVLERHKSGKKLTPSMALLLPYVLDAEELVKNFKKSELNKAFEGRAKQAIADVRDRLFLVAQEKFGVILGQTWFSDAEEPGIYKTKIARREGEFEVEMKLVDKEVEV